MLSKKLILSFGAVIIALLFSACHCTDPGMVAPNEADESFPVGSWVVTSASSDENGNLISSLTTYSEEINNISVNINNKITVSLMARDEQSGIKHLEMQGGFGYTCSDLSGTASNVFDGIIPLTSKDLALESGCAKTEAYLDAVELISETCELPFVLTEGGYSFTGIVHNHAGLEILTRLNINLAP